MSDWFFEPLLPMKYGLIVADVPLRFDTYSDKGDAKAPQAQYPTMTVEELCALQVGHLAGRDCWLMLWAWAPHLPSAFKMIEAWGFTYVSKTTWRKTTKKGKVRMGTGYVVRSMVEEVLIARVGAPPYAKALPGIFDGVVREHSRKPEEFYTLMEAFAPRAFRLDLFSRKSRPGWDTWGNEARKFDAPISGETSLASNQGAGLC